MNPMRSFFNECAATWDEKNAPERSAVSERLIRGLGIEPGSRVLDVGCGTGLIIQWLLEAVGPAGRVTGLDIAEKMLIKAREKYRAANLEFIHADIESAPFLDYSFDEVICHNCFPHLADKDKAAREIFRILKAGGRVVICHNEGRQEVNAIHRRIGGRAWRDILPGEGRMRDIFETSGFRSIDIDDGGEWYVLQARKPLPFGCET